MMQSVVYPLSLSQNPYYQPFAVQPLSVPRHYQSLNLCPPVQTA